MSIPLEHSEFRSAFGVVCWLMLLAFLAAVRVARFTRQFRRVSR